MELACEKAYHKMGELLIAKQTLEAEVKRSKEDKGIDHEGVREYARDDASFYCGGTVRGRMEFRSTKHSTDGRKQWSTDHPADEYKQRLSLRSTCMVGRLTKQKKLWRNGIC